MAPKGQAPADPDGISIITNHGGCKFSAASTRMLENALRDVLRKIGEKGNFKVSLYSSSIRSDHSSPGFRWRAATQLGIDGTYYENGQREERVGFYLNSDAKNNRDMGYKTQLCERLKAATGDNNTKEEAATTEEPAPDQTVLVVPEPATPQKTEVTRHELEMVVDLVQTHTVAGYISTPSLRDTLTEIVGMSSLSMTGDDLLGLLLKHNFIKSQLKPEGYVLSVPEDLPPVFVPAITQTPPPPVTESANPKSTPPIPEKVLDRVATLLFAHEEYEKCEADLKAAQGKLTTLTNSEPSLTSAFDKQQAEELEEFQRSQVTKREQFLSGLRDQRKPLEEQVAVLTKRIDPNTELSRKRAKYIAIFQNI